MPTAREIAFAKAAMRKAKEEMIDWSDPKAAAEAVKKYPAPGENPQGEELKGKMHAAGMRVQQTAPKAKQ